MGGYREGAGRKKRSQGATSSESFVLWEEHIGILHAWARKYGFLDADGKIDKAARSRTMRMVLKESEKWLTQAIPLEGAPERSK